MLIVNQGGSEIVQSWHIQGPGEFDGSVGIGAADARVVDQIIARARSSIFN